MTLGNPKAEGRRPKAEVARSPAPGLAPSFGFRPSTFFRPSASCLRVCVSGGSVCGFTLVELMVVIVLIGILSAMILPNMKGTYGDALLRSTSRELVNAF